MRGPGQVTHRFDSDWVLVVRTSSKKPHTLKCLQWLLTASSVCYINICRGDLGRRGSNPCTRHATPRHVQSCLSPGQVPGCSEGGTIAAIRVDACRRGSPYSCQPPRHSIPAALVGLGTAAPLIPDTLLILVLFSLNFCPGGEGLCDLQITNQGGRCLTAAWD